MGHTVSTKHFTHLHEGREASSDMQYTRMIAPDDWKIHHADLEPVIVACSAANVDELVAESMYLFLLARKSEVEGYAEHDVAIYPGFLFNLHQLGMRRLKEMKLPASSGESRPKTADVSVPVAVLRASKPLQNKSDAALEASSSRRIAPSNPKGAESPISPPPSIAKTMSRRSATKMGKSVVSRANGGVIKPRTHKSPVKSSKSGVIPRPAAHLTHSIASKQSHGRERKASKKLKNPITPRRNGPRAERSLAMQRLREEKHEIPLRRKHLEKALVSIVLETAEIDKKMKDLKQSGTDFGG
jgi:hypothetical protein